MVYEWHSYLQPVKKKAKKTGTGKKKSSGKKKGKSKGKKGKGKKAATGDKKVVPPEPDPFSYAAFLNAYYISHGPVQFLEFRGYNWEHGGAKGKKKKGGKKKKK